MKTILISVIIIININSNSKASLDSFLPTNNVLVDTTKNYDKSCHRPCKFNVKPRKCNYDFVIEPTVHDGRTTISINGESPGPAIHVCLHDIIVVRVKNKVNQDVAIHWHGIQQKGTPYHDGVPMVTQCPITYGSVYQYAFAASSPGTYFYHADSVSQQSDGVFGSLIVDQPRPREPHSSLYNFDNSEENTILISAKFPKPLTNSLVDKNTIRAEALALNGENSYKAYVIPAHAYMFRLINAIAVECPVTVGIEDHGLVVIASDGRPVKPASTRTVRLYPGERMDVVVRADQSTGGYWIRVAGEGACEGLDSYGMLLYSGYNYTTMFEEGPINNNINVEDAVVGQHLYSIGDAVTAPDEIRSFYLGIDRHYPQYEDNDVDFRYLSDAVPKKPFIPAAMTTQEGIVQINQKNFLYPNVPLLLKPKEVLPESFCFVGEEETHKDPQCVQIINARPNETIELVLVNEGFGSNDTYTFHMHGYSMQVLATWQSPAGIPLSREELMKLDGEGKIARNAVNPPTKDTLYVPNKGFVIVRLKTDVGGSWLLECRSCGLSALPVAVLINVQQTIPKIVVDSLPSCRGYKPADVLLN